ncbi:MAG: DNA primase [Nitrospirota bacterium]
MNTDRILEEIKSKINIVDFISDYVQLKKSGQNYKALCPFHSEKTPSFMVSPSKQIFHCFGCGAGGDVVSFLMKQENFSFSEAMRYLAEKAGIKISEPHFNKKVAEKREQMLNIQNEALKFFLTNLKSSELAQGYLKKRGVDKISIDNFCIGYAPNERDALYKHLKKKGLNDSSLKDGGLSISDERGYRDTFRGRIIFPIFNIQNDVIGFGARVMDSSLPKYINSPETDIFKKGETLFGINLAKDYIRKMDYAIIVEGYLDTIMCHQHGFKNTVAPLGTALTAKQLQRLKLLTKKIILVFDGDDAGISAARRSLSILCESDFRAKILLLPQGEDPDSFLRNNGHQTFKKMLSNAISAIEFLMKTSKKDKIDNVRDALSIIASIKDMLIADEMLVELTERSGISESVLRSELKKLKKKVKLNSFEGFLPPKKAANFEEYLLLSAIISFPEKAEGLLSRLNIEDLVEPAIKSLFEKIKAHGKKLAITALLNETTDEEKSLIRELSLKPGFDLEEVDKNLSDCLRRLEQRRFEERTRLMMMQNPADATLHNLLLKEKRRLIKKEHI